MAVEFTIIFPLLNLLTKFCVCSSTKLLMNWKNLISEDIELVKRRNVEMKLWPMSQQSSSEVTTPSIANKLFMFSGNDYLGLSGHPDVRAATQKAAMSTYGIGSRGSPLACGYTSYHAELCELLARVKNKENCVLFPTGFSANLAVLQSLTSAILEQSSMKLIIFSDEYNHASIIDGCRLSKQMGRHQVRLIVYPHKNISVVEENVSRYINDDVMFVVFSDSLFSVDGDFCPLPELATLKQTYGDRLLLILDEAHDTLVTGEGDGGRTDQSLYNYADCRVGTLSKAVGLLGGFVCCSQNLSKLIINRARLLMFSTALPIPVVASAIASIKVGLGSEGTSLRKKLWQLVDLFVDGLNPEYKPIDRSPIIPIILNHEDKALEVSHDLALKGFFVKTLRPPAVPKGTSRLRVTLSAIHTRENVLMLLGCLHDHGIAGYQPKYKL